MNQTICEQLLTQAEREEHIFTFALLTPALRQVLEIGEVELCEVCDHNIAVFHSVQQFKGGECPEDTDRIVCAPCAAFVISNRVQPIDLNENQALEWARQHCGEGNRTAILMQRNDEYGEPGCWCAADDLIEREDDGRILCVPEGDYQIWQEPD